MENMRWATNSELLEELVKVDKELNYEKSGVPITYDDKNLYICDKEYHTLVIGSTGSGKTQSVILPTAKLAINKGESLFFNDKKGELYKQLSGLLNDKDYTINIINLEEKNKGNNWNPLLLPYSLYKDNKKDEAIDLLDELSEYIIPNDKKDIDQFWRNSAISYFKGLVVYLFDNAKEEEINLLSVYKLSERINGSILDKCSLLSKLLLEPILLAPTDTKGSIISVFKTKINRYISRPELLNIICNNDINLNNLDRVAYFFIGDNDNLIPLLLSQIVYTKSKSNNKNRMNFFIDDLDNMYPIFNLAKILNTARSEGMKYIMNISSLSLLEHEYGRTDLERIKNEIGCTIYLSSNDDETNREISKACGDIGFNRLIEQTELNTLKMFEAIVLLKRLYPIRTKLIPDYQIPWPLKHPELDQPKRKEKDIKVYKEA